MEFGEKSSYNPFLSPEENARRGIIINEGKVEVVNIVPEYTGNLVIGDQEFPLTIPGEPRVKSTEHGTLGEFKAPIVNPKRRSIR